MKKSIIVLFILILISFVAPGAGMGQDISNAEIIKELRALNERINRLEEKVSKKDHEIKNLQTKLQEREQRVAAAAPEEEKWTDRIGLSGSVQVAYANTHNDFKDPTNNFQGEKSQSHDITLSTVELGIDADINKYTKGSVLLKYSEDGTDPINVDTGIITVGGIEETYGFYFKGGMYTPHFSELNSYFVSDTLTTQAFEIAESAAEVGYEGDWASAAAGVFHGNVQEDFNTETRINGRFVDANFHNPEDTLGGLYLLVGASYVNNVADTDTLEGQINDLNADGANNDLNDYVPGVAGYVVAEYGDFSFGAEYITATDDFLAGEMAYAVDRNGVARKTEPSAWNLELAYSPIEALQMAVKYEGTDEMFGLLPDNQYGAVVNYEVLENTTISAEYLHGEYDGNNQDPNNNNWIHDEVDLVTLQLTIVF